MQNLPAPRQIEVPAPQTLGLDPDGTLAGAFASFTEAAGALESSYAQLQRDVALLRQELEETNRSLAQSLAANRRYRSFLTRTLEGLPCGVLVLDAGGQVRVANPEARRLLGLDSLGLASGYAGLGRLFDGLFARSPRGEAADVEWTCPTSTGERTLAARRAFMPAEGGRTNETILIIRDKTEENLLAVEREKARRNQALAEMAMVLAHEIRNPLASMELFAGLLAEGAAPTSEADHYAKQLQAGIRGLSATVNNVLQFHGDAALQVVPMDLVRLLGDTVSFLEPLARQRELRIEFESDWEECILPVDRSRLQQVFLNLALNAFRAMAAGGSLKLRLAKSIEGQGVSVFFEDQGSGIAPDHLGRIFEPGFTTTAGSPGLGLAVCRRVVEQHGGRIEVESVLGRGTVFAIHLPVEGVRE